jgi:cytochrome c-type biogenesis protein CcmH
MVAQNIFWFIAGLMLGGLAVAMYSALSRGDAVNTRWRSRALPACVATVLIALALSLYFAWGRPELIGATSARAIAHPMRADGDAGSLDAVAERLAVRLASGNGSAAEWALLAQTYDALGRSSEAAVARTRAAPTDSTANPSDAVEWIENARRLRRERDFAGAVRAYRKAVKLDGMTADSWADYADALASQAGGKLAGEPGQAIERALALDSRHVKALWLSASLARQEARHADALRTWRVLRGIVPDASPDARIIDVNVEEAQQLASSDTVVAGVVEIDSSLLASVHPDSVLFVFAKSPDSPGPPLAVWRVSPRGWPVTFRLDDSMAMTPGRRLSDFESIVIEARLSRSGRAEPQPGDLRGASPRLRLQDAKAVKLRIASKVT